MPVLVRHRHKRDHAYGQESQRQHPPIHRRTVGEILQPTVYAVPGDRSTEDEAYQQNPEVAHIEQYKISPVVDPNTLRTAISFRLYSLSNTTRPNTPTIEIKIATRLNKVIKEPIFNSFS